MLTLPPPLWSLLFLIVTTGISYLAAWPTSPYMHSVPVGLVLIAVGLVPPIWAIAEFHRQDTQLSVTSDTNNKLVIGGPFRFSRNPIYLGLIVFTLGVAVTCGALPLFAVPVLTFATVNWVHIRFEQAKMRRQFGAAFEDYARKVRRWI